MVTLLQYTFQALCHLLTEEKTGTLSAEGTPGIPSPHSKVVLENKAV